MSGYVLRLVGLASGAPSAPDAAPAGAFVRSWDPRADGGRGRVEVTPDRKRAKVYAGKADALREWQSGALRAFTALIEEAEPADDRADQLARRVRDVLSEKRPR